MRPILHARDVLVLDGIVIAIGNVIAEIALVADVMLPIPALPDATFAFLLAHRAQAFGFRKGFSKPCFDKPDAGWKIIVPGRQGYDGVQMVRQDDKCIKAERIFAFGARDAVAQEVELFR